MLRRGPHERSLPRGRVAEGGRAPPGQLRPTASQRVSAAQALEGAAASWPRAAAAPARREGRPARHALSPAPEGPRASRSGAAPQGEDWRSRSSSPAPPCGTPGTCSLHCSRTRVAQPGAAACHPSTVSCFTRAARIAPDRGDGRGRPGGCGCDPRAGRRTGPYFSVVPAAVLVHAAGQGGEAGLPGLPAGSR